MLQIRIYIFLKLRVFSSFKPLTSFGDVWKSPNIPEKQLKINNQLIDIINQPLMEDDIAEIEATVAELPPNINSSKFLFMYEKDQLGNSIPRVNEWLLNNFGFLNQQS